MRRSIVVVPGLKDVVHGSTWATSSSPRVSAWSSFACLPDEPRKIRGFSISSSTPRWELYTPPFFVRHRLGDLFPEASSGAIEGGSHGVHHHQGRRTDLLQ